MAGDVLETGVQYSLKQQDLKLFDQYMSQLKTYYFDYRCAPPFTPPIIILHQHAATGVLAHAPAAWRLPAAPAGREEDCRLPPGLSCWLHHCIRARIPFPLVHLTIAQELERLNPALLQDNVYIKHPVALEQFLVFFSAAACHCRDSSSWRAPTTA